MTFREELERRGIPIHHFGAYHFKNGSTSGGLRIVYRYRGPELEVRPPVKSDLSLVFELSLGILLFSAFRELR